MPKFKVPNRQGVLVTPEQLEKEKAAARKKKGKKVPKKAKEGLRVKGIDSQLDKILNDADPNK